MGNVSGSDERYLINSKEIASCPFDLRKAFEPTKRKYRFYVRISNFLFFCANSLLIGAYFFQLSYDSFEFAILGFVLVVSFLIVLIAEYKACVL
jgi:hypothetical protein